MRNKIRKSKETGQSLIEYALIIVLIAAASVGVLYLTGTSIQDIYTSLLCSFQGNEECLSSSLFTQDFDDDFSGWENGLWRNKNRKWWLEDGKLVSDRSAALLFDGNYSGDYSIKLDDVEFKSYGNIWEGLSLHFNSSDENSKLDGYAFRIQSRPEGDFAYFQKYINGKGIMPGISELQPLPPSFDWDSTSDIQVDVQNGTFTAYINGQQIAQGQDSTFTQGQVGLSSHNNSTVSIESIDIDSIGN